MKRRAGRTGAAAALLLLALSAACAAGGMRGNGSFQCQGAAGVQEVIHGFTLPCTADAAPPADLTLTTWGGDSFHLLALRTARCGPTAGAVRTLQGEGEGLFNGRDAAIAFVFTAAGGPSSADTAEVVITTAAGGAPLLRCGPALPLSSGRHQAEGAVEGPRPSVALAATPGAIYSPFAAATEATVRPAQRPPPGARWGAALACAVAVLAAVVWLRRRRRARSGAPRRKESSTPSPR